jgi:hypothetical protein
MIVSVELYRSSCILVRVTSSHDEFETPRPTAGLGLVCSAFPTRSQCFLSVRAMTLARKSR